MKKNLTKPVIAVLLGALTFSSCIGSFSLTNSVLNWNKRATDNKFVNEIIFVLISPAYAVCSVADLLVLNSIEFWTGNKVIGQVGTTKDVMGKDGRMYAIKTLKNGYEITDQMVRNHTLCSTRSTRVGHTARMAISVSFSASTRMAASRLACQVARRSTSQQMPMVYTRSAWL